MAVNGKKQLKMTNLIDAAYDLFTSKGINETSIDDIVKKACVAKGTFYLYFKDKYDLVDRLVLKKSGAVIEEALDEVEAWKERENAGFESTVIHFVDYLVDYFSENKELLAIIYKNLSWGFYKEAVNSEKIGAAIRRITLDRAQMGITPEEVRQTLYVIVEMAGSVCYNAIITEKPYTMEEIKPTLYTLIRRLLH